MEPLVEGEHMGELKETEESGGAECLVLYFYWTKTNVVKCFKYIYVYIRGWGILTFRRKKDRKEMQCPFSINKVDNGSDHLPNVYNSFSPNVFT